MNRITKITVNWIIGIGIFLALGISGDIERNEAVNTLRSEAGSKLVKDL